MKKRYLPLLLLLLSLVGSGLAHAKDPSRPEQSPPAGSIDANANDQDAAAMYLLGSMFAEGRDVAQDDWAAFRWFARSATLGNADAMNRVGVAYAMGRGVRAADADEALRWFRRAAEKGSVEAMTNLARVYYRGDGTSVSYAEAAQWFERAAERGDPSAMNNLATMYGQGRGVAQDVRKAFALYQRSAGLGNALAMLNLAGLYSGGEIVERDDVAAFVWFARALEAGLPEPKRTAALRDMDALASRLNQDQLAQARRLIGNVPPETERVQPLGDPSRSSPTNSPPPKTRTLPQSDLVVFGVCAECRRPPTLPALQIWG